MEIWVRSKELQNLIAMTGRKDLDLGGGRFPAFYVVTEGRFYSQCSLTVSGV